MEYLSTTTPHTTYGRPSKLKAKDRNTHLCIYRYLACLTFQVWWKQGYHTILCGVSSPQEVTYQNIVNTQDRFPALWSLGGCHVMETPVYGTRSSLVEVCFDWPATHAFLCHRWICSTVFFYKYKIYSRSVVTSAFATDHSSVLSCSFSPPTLQCYRLWAGYRNQNTQAISSTNSQRTFKNGRWHS